MSEQPPHLSPEQLDDLVAQTADGSPARSGADDPAADHLAQCPDCTAAVRTQLAVRSLLRTQPDPGPMPSDVADRIDAALASAATDSVATSMTPGKAAGRSDPADDPASSTGGPIGTVLPMEPARERRLARLSPATVRVGKVLVGVAAAALIAGGGYAALHTSPNSSAASSAKDKSSGSSLAAGAAAPQASRPVQVQASGTAYTKANIVAKVTSLMATSAQAGGVTRPAPDAAAESTLTTPAGLHACLQALDAGNAQPLLVDLATFDGKPAAVLVLPDGTGREVWVVSRSCAGTNDGTAYYATLP
jgi:hypothetical protein